MFHQIHRLHAYSQDYTYLIGIQVFGVIDSCMFVVKPLFFKIVHIELNPSIL